MNRKEGEREDDGGIKMGKHPIGGMRSMMIANRNADMRRWKKAFLRNKERTDVDRQKKGSARCKEQEG